MVGHGDVMVREQIEALYNLAHTFFFVDHKVYFVGQGGAVAHHKFHVECARQAVEYFFQRNLVKVEHPVLPGHNGVEIGLPGADLLTIDGGIFARTEHLLLFVGTYAHATLDKSNVGCLALVK